VVEYEPQTRIEGDIQQMPCDFPVTELWQVLAGHRLGRANEQQITVFDSVGFALEDFSALRFVGDLAKTLSVGKTMHLIPQPDNPKDLYQYVATDAIAATASAHCAGVHGNPYLQEA
jgi:ornithine cyclodeaminase